MIGPTKTLNADLDQVKSPGGGGCGGARSAHRLRL